MFARTNRLLLRPGWAEDAPALNESWADEAIVRNLPSLPAGQGVEAAAAFLRQKRGELTPYSLAFARTGGAPRLIGGCGVTPDASGQPELSFWIARPYWGLGFATEAAEAMVGAVRANGRANGPARLVAYAPIGNNAACHVLGKLGFCPTGHIVTNAGTGMTLAEFRDCGFAPMRDDAALELYRDRALIAA